MNDNEKPDLLAELKNLREQLQNERSRIARQRDNIDIRIEAMLNLEKSLVRILNAQDPLR